MSTRSTSDVSRSQIGSVQAVLVQHAEDAAILHSIRTALTSAPHVKLKHIQRFDDRVAAHLDGLGVAGEGAWPVVDAALASPSPGAVFAAAVVAIEGKSAARLDRLYALAEAEPEAGQGLMAALGWVEREQLRDVVSGLLSSPISFWRLLGIAACAMHRVDPGRARDAALGGPVAALRARALRTAGELGRRELLPTCLGMLKADDTASRFWAAWSAVVLGNRGAGLAALKEFGEIPGLFQARAFRLALQALELGEARAWLRGMAGTAGNLRFIIQGTGIVGDPSVVPWLIEQMSEPRMARVAGEAFSVLTGLDLAYLDLELKPPANGGAGPNDDPDDPNVDMDADDGLPWPDPERISQWWRSNGDRFTPGSRYFLGTPLTRETCVRGLKEGFQRQRILAAHYLCVLEPGAILFEWRAPSARQLRLLAAMG